MDINSLIWEIHERSVKEVEIITDKDSSGVRYDSN